MRNEILVHINGKEHRAGPDDAFTTLSTYLRLDLCATGTKIVCEEGDCGACTVLVRRSKDEPYVAINSCIQAMCQMDGTSIVTVEGLKEDGGLSAVQQSMVVHHGAQCGYCTPGFVVAMAGLFETRDRVDEACVRDGLTGNLCRCTGYEPIIKAALAVDGASMPKLRDRYPDLPSENGALTIEANGRTFYAPTTIEDAVRFKRDHAPVTILQGGTDVGVWVNKRHFTSPALLSLAKIRELCEAQATDHEIIAGANVTLSRFEELVRDRIPQLHEILHVFGSPQIKNAGTLAGNIANGSPIADTLPYLFVSGATLELTGAAGRRSVPVEKFYKGYKTFDLAADEIITRVTVPVVRDTLRLYKVSRRRDLDISAFTAAIRLRMNGSRIEEALVAYGGVAPVVLRLPQTEQFLAGREPSLDLFQEAGRIARGEVKPITDVRGSAAYRLRLSENVMPKFWHDAFGAI